jgi:hypothetical protein
MKQGLSIEPIQLQGFPEPFFRDAIRRVFSEHAAHYGNRLTAFYVSGSVHRNEAVPGVSDVDTCVFIRDEYSKEDGVWEEKAEKKLKGEIPGFEHTSRATSVDRSILKGTQPNADEWSRIGTRAWVERLRYDSTLVWGQDVTEGVEIPPPDRSWARRYVASVGPLIRYAAGLEDENRTDFRLPDEPSPRLRKLARLAVLSGAYLLMGCGEFHSFKGADVLPALKWLSPQWVKFLDETERLYIPPTVATEEDVHSYLSRLVPWVKWIETQLE